MASLIRESPSANHLLPLTTALDWEMGKDPRVAIEIQDVVEFCAASLLRFGSS